MKNTRTLRILAILLSAAFVGSCTKQAPRGPSTPGRAVFDQAMVIYAAGDVIATGVSGAVAVEIGDVLTKGQSVKTGALSECELELGNKTAIRIEGNTVVCLDEVLLRPGETDIGIRAVLGTVLCKVDKLSGSERFRVRTQSAVCSVRGTEFSVTVFDNNDTLLVVKQGRVGMLPAALDIERLAAELKTADPEVEAALAELEGAELEVGDAQEAVVTEAASKQAEESVRDVESEIALISGKETPSAAEKEKFRTAVRKAAAEVRASVKAPKPVGKERIKALEKLEDLKRRIPEKPPAQTEDDTGMETTATSENTEMGWEEPGPGEAILPEPDKNRPVLVIWVGQTDDASLSNTYMRALDNNFKRRNPDIIVKWEMIKADALDQRVQTALASDRGPDIFQTYGGELFRRHAAAGRLLDVTDELSGIPASGVAKSIMSFNDRLYGVAPVFAVAGLYFNEEIFRKLRLNVPANLGEMEKNANVLNVEGIQPFACGAGDKWPVLATYMYLVNRFGGDAYERARDRRMRFNSDPFLRAGNKLKEWAEKGFYGNNPMGESFGTAMELMKTGRAGMMVGGSWLCKEFSDRNQTDQAIGFVPFPVVIGGMGETGDVMGMVDVAFAARSSADVKRGAVLRFFEYAMSMEARLADPGLVYSVPGMNPAPACIAEANGLIARARSVQSWWDRDLPPALREPVNDSVSSFLAPGTDVRDALARFDELLAKNLGPVK
jgi:raffinose/stachyose/melibiose transport system substrate-binding protein